MTFTPLELSSKQIKKPLTCSLSDKNEKILAKKSKNPIISKVFINTEKIQINPPTMKEVCTDLKTQSYKTLFFSVFTGEFL